MSWLMRSFALGVVMLVMVGHAHCGLRFAIQGDIHNFSRVPEGYIRKMLSDAKTIGCDFVAFLGDIMDGTKGTPMRLSVESGVPIVWQRGDHEFFSEWGRTCVVRLSRFHELLSEAPDTLAFFRGAIPRFEAMTGLPTAWAFLLRGILFVVTHNGKNHVWHDWQLRWLNQLLTEHRQYTTVILSHRTLDERGETAESLRKLLSGFPQVVLFCDAHIHSPHPFRIIGNALQVGVEGDSKDEGKLSYEGNWYVVVELTKDAIRVMRRRMESNELLKLHERNIATSLNDSKVGKVHLAFLMSDRGVRFNPAVWLRNAKLRVWGVEQEQVLPTPDEGELYWRALGGSKIELLDGDDEWRKLGIGKVMQVSAHDLSDEVALAEASLQVSFNPDPNAVGIAGTALHGTQYIPLILAKSKKGTRVRMEIDAITDDGELESHHFVEGESDGGIMALQGATGHIYLGAQSIFEKPTLAFWRWEGVDGKTEVDTPHPLGKPRRATKLLLRLKVIKPKDATCVQFVGFVFPELGGFFTPAKHGRTITQSAKVTVGNVELPVGDLKAGSFKEFTLGDVAGGEKISLKCDGSKLALVELIGDASGLMWHALRRIPHPQQKKIDSCEPTEQAKAFTFYGWDEIIGKTCLWLFNGGL